MRHAYTPAIMHAHGERYIAVTNSHGERTRGPRVPATLPTADALAVAACYPPGTPNRRAVLALALAAHANALA